MITPLIILKDILPQEILDNIQKFLINETIIEPIQNYLEYLYYKKDLYENFVLNNYVMPLCNCNSFSDNGLYKLYKWKECSACFEFEAEYELNYPIEFKENCIDNPQSRKIFNQK